MSLLDGLDLCALPAGTAPDGVQSNFIDPPTYAPAVLGISVVVLFFASLFTSCRLIANWKKLTWTDHFNTLALIFSLAQSGIVLSQLKYARHQWDIPACWFFGDYVKLTLVQATFVTLGLQCSKASLLLLFLKIFDIQGRMRLAIRIGLAAVIIIYGPNIPLAFVYTTPSPGQSWDDVMLSKKPNKALYWGIVQSALGTLLDLYIFILPLPAITQLQISRHKRNQLVLVFSTASLGVVANILSLVYRVVEFRNMDDATWYLSSVYLCTIVEVNIAIIVCSVPGLAKFLRTHATDWTLLQSFRSKFFSPGNSANTSESDLSKKHGWPATRQAVPSSHHDVEIASHESPSPSLQHDEMTESHGYVDLRERWQVDPYLDTRGPEYSWMYTENPENGLSVGISPLEKAHGSQSIHEA